MTRSSDVVIVGGGVIGLSIAYALAREGLRPMVLDRREPGREASWAGAGLIPPIADRAAADAGARINPLVALRSWSARLYPEWTAALHQETGIDPGYRRTGGVDVAWTEREDDMLALFIDALRVHGPPDALYLDNGATYRGEALITVCHRIGTLLLHPKPYDPQARGKMERFWRTLREQVLVFCTGETTLEELNRRLRAFLDKYHRTPHAGLLGRAPGAVYRAHQRTDDLDEQKLHKALMVRETRQVSPDNLVRIDGIAWELDQGFLAGKRVTIVRSLLTPGAPPAVELEGKLLPLHPVDPVHNAKRPRPASAPQKPAKKRVTFNPVGTLLEGAKAKKGDAK